MKTSQKETTQSKLAVKCAFGKWTESLCAWSNMRERMVGSWGVEKKVWLLSSCPRGTDRCSV